ncbi:hypothetical protein PLESTM_000640800 [Pleodorina starrii]|nr:hypothetical protein PLESTM_000640800 [Pleodorina starrii]
MDGRSAGRISITNINPNPAGHAGGGSRDRASPDRLLISAPSRSTTSAIDAIQGPCGGSSLSSKASVQRRMSYDGSGVLSSTGGGGGGGVGGGSGGGFPLVEPPMLLMLHREFMGGGPRSRFRVSCDGGGGGGKAEWRNHGISCPASPTKTSSPASNRPSSILGHTTAPNSPRGGQRVAGPSFGGVSAPPARLPATAATTAALKPSRVAVPKLLIPTRPLPSPPPTPPPAASLSPRPPPPPSPAATPRLPPADAPMDPVNLALLAIRLAVPFCRSDSPAAAVPPLLMPLLTPLLAAAPPPPLPQPVPEETAARIEGLRARCQAKLEELQRCSQLISMFLNRCNANWAESQAWTAPSMVTQPQLTAFTRSDAGIHFREELLRMLCSGAVAVHLRAGDDFLEPGMSYGGLERRGGGMAGFTTDAGGGGGPLSVLRWGSKWPGAPAAPIAAGGPGGGSGLAVPGGLYRSTAPDVWTQDPWRMLETYRPGLLIPGSMRIEGVPLDCRYVAALVLALEALAGREAVEKLPLVLVVSEDQQDEVVRQLWAYRFFGIPRENVVFLVQPSHPGYCYHASKRTWLPGDASHSLPLGSGYGLMQLAWREEALAVSEEGCLEPLRMSALSWMEARGVTWLVSRRARDVSLLASNGVLDLNTLAYGLYYRTDRSPETNIVMEAASTSSLLLSRVLDSVIMSRRLDEKAAAAAAAINAAYGTSSSSANTSSAVATSGFIRPGTVVISPDSTPPASPTTSSKNLLQSTANNKSPWSAVASGDPLGGRKPKQQQQPQRPSHQVVELSPTDLATPAMRAVLADYQEVGRVMAGLGRYMMHLPSITPMLAGRLSVLRPKLGLVDDLLHVRMELSDLTSAHNASSLLLQARSDTPQLVVQDDVETLLPLLQAQDSNPLFRQLLVSYKVVEEKRKRHSPSAASDGSRRVGGGGSSGSGEGGDGNNHRQGLPSPTQPPPNPKVQRILVFLAANTISTAAVAMAATLAQPGRDTVTLATVVSEVPGVRQHGEELLAKYSTEFKKLGGAHYTCEVVERGNCGLIDCMEEFSSRHGATLVVMGSDSLTSKANMSVPTASATSPASLHIIGSVTLALLRRLPMPLLLVTRASATAVTAAATAGSVEQVGGIGGGGRRRTLRCLAVLEGHAAGMVDYLASRLCDGRAGDQLYLSYIRTSTLMTRQQLDNIRALISRFTHQAAAHNMRPAKTLILDGPADRALATAVADHGLDLLAVPAVPLGHQVPPAVLATMRAASTAVLWYRDAQQLPEL